jgi:hypothetical protein
MPSIARQQENTTSKINWFTMSNLILTSAAVIEYRIFDISAGLPGSQVFPGGGLWENVSAPPGRFATGSYYAYDNSTGKGWMPAVAANIGTNRIFWRWKMLAGDPYDQGAEDFEVTADILVTTADWLTVNDLYNLVGSERVLQLLDDERLGSLGSTNARLQSVLKSAESEAYSRMLRSWSKSNVEALAGADEGFRRHCAWVALEFMSERRPAFCADDGKGAYWAEFERAISHFEALSKGRLRSVGESAGGTSKNLGGNLRPTTTAKQAMSFVFATSEKNPNGSGGY